MKTNTKNKELGQKLRKCQFDFIEPGQYNVDEVYDKVRWWFEGLCGDVILCSHRGECRGGPEWEHQVRRLLDEMKNKGLIQHDVENKKWIFKGEGRKVNCWRMAMSADEVFLGDILPDELIGTEGKRQKQLIEHIQRERALRNKKIKHTLRENGGKLRCEVPGCGFDFESVYGDWGKGYAQVHHLMPLGQSKSITKTAFADLAVVCANCHAMIHRGGECRKLSELIERQT